MSSCDVLPRALASPEEERDTTITKTEGIYLFRFAYDDDDDVYLCYVDLCI